MFVGHTRFSLFDPNSTSWRASNGSRFATVDEYHQYLFSAERLDPRMGIFLGISMPQLALAAEGFEVKHVVSFPATLPDEYKQQLRAAAERYPFMVLDEQVDGQPMVTPFTIAADLYKESGEPFAHYRLDDDDLLPADYFEQVRGYVRHENTGMMVSLGAGATALYVDGQYYNLRQCYAPMIAIGLLSICRYDQDGTLLKPVRAAHNMSDRKNPVILDSRKPGFLWTRHVSQDTSLGWGTPDREDMVDIILRYMDKYPAAATDDGFEEAFPSAVSLMTGRTRPDGNRRQAFREDIVLTNLPTRLPLQPVAGTFTVTGEMVCPGGSGENNALLCFELTDSAGSRLDASRFPADLLVGSGLKSSANPEIGFFTYLPVDDGTNSFRLSVTVPHGANVSGLSIRRFRDYDLAITLRNILIEERSAVAV